MGKSPPVVREVGRVEGDAPGISERRSAISHSPADRNLRIAYMVASFPYVSETFVVNQVVGMAARGHQVDVYTTAPGATHTIPAGVERYRLMERTCFLFGSDNHAMRLLKAFWWSLRDGWRVPGLVLRSLNIRRYGRRAASLALLSAALILRRRNGGKYDIVHCQFGTYGNLAIDLMEIGALSGKLVVSFRGYDATKTLRANPHIYDDLFRCADLVTPVSETIAARLVNAGCDRAKIVVHHSGIEYARFGHVRPSRAEGAPTRLVSIARLTEKKGIEYAIRAVARVVSSGRSVAYEVIGEGPLRSVLEGLIHELDVAEHIRLLGWRSHNDVIGMLEKAHVLLAPSVTAADGDEEGIPNSVKEAMAMGLPVICTHHGGNAELVEDGVSGFLVPERDDEALAERLTYLVDHPETWGLLGRSGRERIKSAFDIHKLNDELTALYRNVLAAGGTARAF
jgi:colanic acid/amylovoran biosynthesis glycosyltransferase